MILQLSAGQGPAECELAVGKLLRALQREIADLEVLVKIPGSKADGYKSVQIKSKIDLAELEGTVKWICQSPYRPHHKRKNWFVDVSICKEAEERSAEVNLDLVRFETFRSGGPGGQNVNKVETGVRAVHIPTGISVVCMDTRSQHQNRQLALNRLCDILAENSRKEQAELVGYHRLEHYRLERGNARRIYEGMDFKRIL